MKSSTKFLLAFGIIFMLLFIVEYNQDEPVDWSPGFGKTEKKPFGDYLLFELLPEIFGKQKIETVNLNIIDQLDEEYLNKTKVNYIFINNEVLFNEYESNELLNFVSRGNNAFIASGTFSDTLLSTLGLKQRSFYDENYLYSYYDTLFHFNFCNQIKSIDSGYTIFKDYTTVNNYFDSIQDNKKMLAADTSHHCILTEVNYGSGKIILCSIPYTFTNYYLLKPGTLDFVLKTLTRLPAEKVWWDEHYKSGKNKDTPFRYILEKKSLKWAYYLGLAGICLFVVFMGKRRQRIIPIQDPMKNTSLEFAETVGQVYYEKGDHLNLALKKIKYFYEFIRSKYYLNVNQELKHSRTEFLENLANKSGKSLDDVKNLFDYINYVENTMIISEKELIYLNTLIEKFKFTHTTKTK